MLKQRSAARKRKVLSDTGKLDVLFILFLFLILFFTTFEDGMNQKPKEKVEENVCIETRLTLNKNEVHVFCGKKVSLDTN